MCGKWKIYRRQTLYARNENGELYSGVNCLKPRHCAFLVGFTCAIASKKPLVRRISSQCTRLYRIFHTSQYSLTHFSSINSSQAKTTYQAISCKLTDNALNLYLKGTQFEYWLSLLKVLLSSLFFPVNDEIAGPMAERSKARVYGRLLAGIAG